jgi:hypothetical protein
MPPMKTPNAKNSPLPPTRYPLPPGTRPLTNFKPRVPRPLIDLAAHDARVMAQRAAAANGSFEPLATIEPVVQPVNDAPQIADNGPSFDDAEFPTAPSSPAAKRAAKRSSA